jgi:hypothetical protein
MRRILTAKEFLLKEQYSSSRSLEEILIDFANQHVRRALKIASMNCKIVMKPDMDFHYEDYVEGVDVRSILESYPKELIK